MSNIKTFVFSKSSLEEIKSFEYGKNWPVVYILENGRSAYVGETVRMHQRAKEHFDNPERLRLNKVHVITDDEYNVSATLDIESWLIQYMAADDVLELQNGNTGLKNHNYYDKEKYKAKFELIWKKLQDLNIVSKDLVQIRNSDLFKYSPYKSLTEDQMVVTNKLFNDIKKDKSKTWIINGKPGTGKTILAIYLIKFLYEQEDTKNLKIGLVIPMTSLRTTVKRVFSKIKGLKSSMVIGPNDVTKEKYDLLIVDEAHRLKQRKNIVNFRSFDSTNLKFGLDNSGTELDWVMKSSKYQIFFYDKNQTIKPADVGNDKFKKLDAIHYDLVSQQRISAGEEYINFIDDLFDLQDISKYIFPDYDFRIYTEISDMVSDIKKRNNEFGLARMVAGFAWEWKSRNNKSIHDIEIQGTKLIWNSVVQDWVNSKNAANEVGCIHTVQGYDLNYVGVIIGPELSFDDVNNKLLIKSDNYYDTNGWKGINDPKELERYIINIYKTLLARGMKGTYIYVVDEKLSRYFSKILRKIIKNPKDSSFNRIVSPYSKQFISIPLVGSAPCGEPLLGEQNIEEEILVDRSKIVNGINYFILKASGDSMNKVGISDGDLVLCKQKFTANDNDNVAALIGDNVTIKEFHKDSSNIILKPRSTNDQHKPLIYIEADNVQIQGVVQEVISKMKE